MDLAQRLTEGVQALRDGRAAHAVALLAVVADDPELAAAADLRDIYARVCSLYAQALLESGQAAQARHPLRAALDALTELQDQAGIDAVTELQGHIAEAISADFKGQARRRSLAELPDLDESAPDERRLSRWIEQAAAAVAAGDAPLAADLATRAKDLASKLDDTRHYVLASLVLVEAQPALALQHLESARMRADDADEFNLVGAIAKAATAAGLELPPVEHPG